MAAPRTRSGLQLGVSMLVALMASRIEATCPTDVCDCLGQAGHFAVVAGDLSTKAGRIIEDGYGYAVGPTVEASVCAKIGRLSGKLGGETSITEDVVFTATSGVAAALKGYIDYGYVYPGVLIDGDLLTGGGQVTGGEFAQILGTTDTTGQDPSIAECRQALSDAASASATLAALPPTQSLHKLLVDGARTVAIDAGPGTNVIQLDALVLKPMKSDGYNVGSVLNINLGATTDSVIINVTGSLSIGVACAVNVTGGDIESVIINVVGAKPTVKVKADAIVGPAILAPTRKMLVATNAQTANVYAASGKIKGAQIVETLLCP